jgi:hypothetical protein
MGWILQGSNPNRDKRCFNFLHIVHTRSGAHMASYSIGGSYTFPGVKQPEHEVDFHPVLRLRVRSYTSTTLYSFLACTSTTLPLLLI